MSGAIGINVIGASDRGPVAYRAAMRMMESTWVSLPLPSKWSHMHAADRDGNAGCGEDQAFDGESRNRPAGFDSSRVVVSTELWRRA